MKLFDKAWQTITDAGELRRSFDQRRVMHDRDEEAASRASALYEELRLLSNGQLTARLVLLGVAENEAVRMARQQLIADIIEKEASQ